MNSFKELKQGRDANKHHVQPTLANAFTETSSEEMTQEWLSCHSANATGDITSKKKKGRQCLTREEIHYCCLVLGLQKCVLFAFSLGKKAIKWIFMMFSGA